MTERYHTKNFSLSTPAGSNVFEFFIASDHQIGTTAKICEIFARCRAKILQMYGSFEAESNSFVYSFFCDFARANTTVEAVIRLIRNLQTTRKIDAFNCQNKLYDQAFFPLVVMQKHRVIMMRAEPLLRIEKRLGQRFATGASVIMFEEGKAYASETIEYYRQVMGSEVSSENFIGNIIDGLRATGWGLFSFASQVDSTFELEISHPPINRKDSLFESRFVIGVAAGVLESIFSTQLRVNSSHYDAKTDTLRILFEKMVPQNKKN